MKIYFCSVIYVLSFLVSCERAAGGALPCYSVTGVDSRTGQFGKAVVVCPMQPSFDSQATKLPPSLSWYPELLTLGAYTRYQPSIDSASIPAAKSAVSSSLIGLNYAAQTMAAVMPAMIILKKYWGDDFKEILSSFRTRLKTKAQDREKQYLQMQSDWDSIKGEYVNQLRQSAKILTDRTQKVREQTQHRLDALPYPQRVATFSGNGIVEAMVRLRYRESSLQNRTDIEDEREKIEDLPSSLGKEKARKIIEQAVAFPKISQLVIEAKTVRQNAIFGQTAVVTPISDRVSLYHTQRLAFDLKLPIAKDKNADLALSAEILHFSADNQMAAGNLASGEELQALALGTIDAALGFVPVVSVVKDLTALVTGHNYITGEDLGWGGRVIAAVGVLTAGGSHLISTPVAAIFSGIRSVVKSKDVFQVIEDATIVASKGVNALGSDWVKTQKLTGALSDEAIAFVGKFVEASRAEVITTQKMQSFALKHSDLGVAVRSLGRSSFSGIEARAIPKVIVKADGTSIYSKIEEIFLPHDGMTFANGRYTIGGKHGDKGLYTSIAKDEKFLQNIQEQALSESRLTSEIALVSTRRINEENLIDLTSKEVRVVLEKRMNIDALVERFESLPNGYIETQILGDVLRTNGVNGLVVPSAFGGINLVRFLK